MDIGNIHQSVNVYKKYTTCGGVDIETLVRCAHSCFNIHNPRVVYFLYTFTSWWILLQYPLVTITASQGGFSYTLLSW